MKKNKTYSSQGWRIFFDLLQKFLSKPETDANLLTSLLTIWRDAGEEAFRQQMGVLCETDSQFKFFLSDLINWDKAVWGRLLKGMTEINAGPVLYLELKNLSPFKNCLLVFANQLGEASIAEEEMSLAFDESAGKYPYQTVIAVSVAEQEVVVL